MKHLNASSGEFTIGSPLMLKLVFTKTPKLDIFLNSFIRFQYLGFVFLSTV